MKLLVGHLLLLGVIAWVGFATLLLLSGCLWFFR
jgi:hypothetical protein